MVENVEEKERRKKNPLKENTAVKNQGGINDLEGEEEEIATRQIPRFPEKNEEIYMGTEIEEIGKIVEKTENLVAVGIEEGKETTKRKIKYLNQQEKN